MCFRSTPNRKYNCALCCKYQFFLFVSIFWNIRKLKQTGITTVCDMHHEIKRIIINHHHPFEYQAYWDLVWILQNNNSFGISEAFPNFFFHLDDILRFFRILSELILLMCSFQFLQPWCINSNILQEQKHAHYFSGETSHKEQAADLWHKLVFLHFTYQPFFWQGAGAFDITGVTRVV